MGLGGGGPSRCRTRLHWGIPCEQGKEQGILQCQALSSNSGRQSAREFNDLQPSSLHNGTGNSGGLTGSLFQTTGNFTAEQRRNSERPAFRDGDAGAAHVQSDHFKKAQQTLPPHLARTPRIVNFAIPQDDWSLLGEFTVG